jgi:anti-sigma B factor antagonist
MQTSYYEEDSHIIFKASGKLDTINAPEFATSLKSILEKSPPSCLLDLSEVTFLSSSGLQVLLAGAKISKKEKIQFAVFGMNEMLNDVFCMSGFDLFIKSFTSKKEAFYEFSHSDTAQ